MYIKVFDGAAVIISEEQDRPCSHPQGHDFNPDNGAMHGAYGNCCAHCNHFVGRREEMRDAAEAQAYAQAMLGATGPVEVREIEWKWGPGDVPKSPVMSATNALTTRLIAAAPDLLEVLVEAEKIITDFDDRDELAIEDVGVLKSIRAAIAKAYGEVK